MFKSIIFLIFLLFSVPSWATTWYVRDGGGTATQCTGTTNAVYPGSGTGQPCALNNLQWLLGSNDAGQTTTTALLSGGDTAYVDGDSDITPGTQAQYITGYGAPNGGYYCSTVAQGGKGPTYAFNCNMLNIPAGSNGNPTQIIGTGTHKPQFYSSNGSYVLLLSSHNYVTLQWLELTDHNACAYNDPTGGCSGNYVEDGIQLSGSNLILTDLYIHGIGRYGINGNGVFGDATFTRVWIIGNGYGGANMGSDGTEAFTGTLTWNQPIIDWNGCVEAYPLTGGIENPSNYSNCFGQASGGYGDGLAYGATGSLNAGNWTITGPGSISFNTQDGLDILHGNVQGTDLIDKMRFEGNAGNQVKITGLTSKITNSLVFGDCGWWYLAAQSLSGGMLPSDSCRALGNVIVYATLAANSSSFIAYNNTIMSNGQIVFLQQGTCDNTDTVTIKNNIVYGGYQWIDDGTINPGGGNTLTTYMYNSGTDGNGANCSGIVSVEDYNLVTGTKNSNSGCNGAHDLCGTSPSFTGTVPIGTSGGGVNTYYQAWSGITLLGIQSGSAAKGAGVAGLTYWNTVNDYYNNARPSISIGGLEQPSTAANGWGCFFNSDCQTNYCFNNICSAVSSFNGTLIIHGNGNFHT